MRGQKKTKNKQENIEDWKDDADKKDSKIRTYKFNSDWIKEEHHMIIRIGYLEVI